MGAASDGTDDTEDDNEYLDNGIVCSDVSSAISSFCGGTCASGKPVTLSNHRIRRVYARQLLMLQIVTVVMRLLLVSI